MSYLTHIAARLFNTPLMIHPGKLNAIIAGLADRLGVDAGSLPDAYTTAVGQRGKGGYRVVDGIAVLDVFGILAHRATLQADSSYVEGYETIAKRIDAALADREVAAIVLNIDSPGGEVSGAFQLAGQILNARAIKPIHAVAGDLAASAGYLIASAAQSVSVSPSGQVGSIGVVTCHVDMSRALDKAGYTVTPIYAGAHKVDGIPYAPLPDDVATRMQADIDHYYAMFVDAVAAARPNLTSRAIRATEAALYIGGKAVAAGLADRVETPDQLLSRLAAEMRRAPLSTISASATAIRSEKTIMTDIVNTPDQSPVTPQYLTPAAVAELCLAAGESALGRAMVGGQYTAEDVQASLADAREIRGMAAAAHMPEEAQPLIVAGISPDQAGKLLVRELARRDAALPIDNTCTATVTGDGRDRLRAGLSQALQIRAGLMADDPKNEFRGHTLLEVARLCLVQAGVSSMPGSKMGMVAMAITHSTSDFPYLLQDTAEKAMLKGYSEADETFQVWTRVGRLSDFKAASRTGMSEFTDLDEVKEGGEFKHGTIGERREQIQLATYGKLFTISRQAIINDDLSAFSDIPRKMGRAAPRKVGDLVYAVLTSNPNMADGVALFHANHSNLAGSSAALALATLSAGRTAMARQTDSSGSANALNIRTKFLILPMTLEDSGNILLNSQYDPDTANKLQRINPAKSYNLTLVSDARLDAASTTAFFLAADQNAFDTIEVAYLDGNPNPYLEQQNGWTVDGVEYKVRLDAAVKALDWRTFYKNAGA